LTDRLAGMLIISAVVAVLASPIGHVAALTVPPMLGFETTTTSGMMAAASGSIFILVWLFAPRYGLVTRLVTRPPETPADAGPRMTLRG
jgi:ABC-type Mn2+/Zn2+ transport system permease subunit